MFFHDPVEDRDYPPGTKHSQKGADVDAYDTVNKYKGHNGCQNDAGDVNDVFRQSEFQTTDIRNDLNNPVCRVGNEPHIEGILRNSVPDGVGMIPAKRFMTLVNTRLSGS